MQEKLPIYKIHLAIHEEEERGKSNKKRKKERGQTEGNYKIQRDDETLHNYLRKKKIDNNPRVEKEKITDL